MSFILRAVVGGGEIRLIFNTADEREHAIRMLTHRRERKGVAPHGGHGFVQIINDGATYDIDVDAITLLVSFVDEDAANRGS
ncbi:MAG: hypothetical protein ACRDHP_19360 [Ktedonobacterales bacterium]